MHQSIYARQLPLLGDEGQARLSRATVAIVGCGGVGSVVANLLARLGVGRLILIDFDNVALENLNRGSLHEFSDLGLPKAYSCQRHVRLINPFIEVRAHREKLTACNADRLLGDADIIVSAVDNMEARHLLNEYAVATGKPLVNVAAERREGVVLPIQPGRTPCLACIYGLRIPPKHTPPVVEPVVHMAAAVAAGVVVRILTEGVVDNVMYIVDGSSLTIESMRVERRSDCPVCVKREFRLLARRC